MRASPLFMVSMVIALLALSPPSMIDAQATPPAAPPSIGLGFGPASIVPLSVGVPVFTMGDQIWVQSFYDSTALYVLLVPPVGSSGSYMGLGPRQLVLLHTILPGDPPGNWTMEMLTSSGGSIGSVQFSVENASSTLEPTFVAAVAQSNSVALKYALPPSDAYHIQACTTGQGVRTTSSFVLPSAIGGSMGIELFNDTAVITTPPTLVSFTGWLELYTARSYMNGTSLVTENLLAAKTGILNIGPTNGSVSGSLVDEMNLRDGRYDLRAFVRLPSGLSAFEAPILLEDGGAWISLAGCTQLADVSSGVFSLTSSLDASNSTWPRSMFLLYSVRGVDSFVRVSVPVMEGRLDVRTSTGEGLSDAKLSLNGTGIMSWSTHASNLYFVGNRFPFNLSVNIDFGGVVSEAFNLSVSKPYDSYGIGVDAGFLTVQTREGGQPLVNASVDFSEPGKSPASFNSGTGATKTLLLPPGEYNVTVTSGTGRSASALAEVTSGETSLVVLDVSPPQPPYLTYLLVIILLAAAALNVKVWRDYLERRAVFR